MKDRGRPRTRTALPTDATDEHRPDVGLVLRHASTAGSTRLTPPNSTLWFRLVKALVETSSTTEPADGSARHRGDDASSRSSSVASVE
ncbi:hypothetical protein D8S78_21270 [Natrialba swarupiae]|nr:hypothetical protein [Natrialba swarupiae]